MNIPNNLWKFKIVIICFSLSSINFCNTYHKRNEYTGDHQDWLIAFNVVSSLQGCASQAVCRIWIATKLYANQESAMIQPVM